MVKGLLKFVFASAVLAVCTVSVKAQEYEYVILPAYLPAIDGVEVQIVGVGNVAMELLGTGWWFAELEATADDKFGFAGHDNATGNDYVLAEYNSDLSGWVEYVLKFGDVWDDDSYKGVPCKWVEEKDLSDTQKYAWKSIEDVIPANVKAVKSVMKKKAVKVYEDGVLYIIKDGVKYNMLGIAQ